MSNAEPQVKLRELDFDKVQEEFPDRWERAQPGRSMQEEIGTGVWELEIPKEPDSDKMGDTHKVYLGERGEARFGACDCKGFANQTRNGKGPCAHLCTLHKMQFIGIIDVPDIDDVAKDVAGSEEEAAPGDPEDAEEPEADSGESDGSESKEDPGNQPKAVVEFQEVEGIGEKAAWGLYREGFESWDDIAGASIGDIAEADNVGEKRADPLRLVARQKTNQELPVEEEPAEEEQESEEVEESTPVDEDPDTEEIGTDEALHLADLDPEWIDRQIVRNLVDSGITTVRNIYQSDVEGLNSVPGVDKEMAIRLKNRADQFVTGEAQTLSPPEDDVEDTTEAEEPEEENDAAPAEIEEAGDNFGGDTVGEVVTIDAEDSMLPDRAISEDPLSTLPAWMIEDIDRGKGKPQPYLTSRGCQVVARFLGLDTKTTAVTFAEETDFEYATYRAQVKKGGRLVSTATGEAHISEDNRGKHELNRQAETRALTRAVKWATGGGMEAFYKAEGDRA